VPYFLTRLEAPLALCVVLEGTMSGTELAEAHREIASLLETDGANQPVHSLWDARRLKVLDVALEELRALDAAMREVNRYSATGRSATLLEEGQVDIGLLTRLLLARGPKGKRERAVFTDYDATLAWLAQT